MKKRVLLLDFDGTLVRHDSFVRFARYSVGTVGFLAAILKTLPWLVGWKMAIVRASVAKQKLFSAVFRGMAFAEFERRGLEFVRLLDGDANPVLMEEVKSQRLCGSRVIVVTASMAQWVAPWCARHGIEEVISTQIECDANGRLTGGFTTPNCNGAEKVRRIIEHVGNLSDYEIWAYGNSRGDYEMLSIADRRFKVSDGKNVREI